MPFPVQNRSLAEVERSRRRTWRDCIGLDGDGLEAREPPLRQPIRELDGDFSRHNLPHQPDFGRAPMRPATLVRTGSAIG